MRIGQYRSDPASSTAALDEAYALTQRAAELDDSDSTCHSLYWRQAGQAHMVLRQLEQALAMFAHVPSRTDRTSAYMAACCARLEQTDRARQFAAECLADNPDFSIRQFVSKEPFRDLTEVDYLAESLRLAGLPE